MIPDSSFKTSLMRWVRDKTETDVKTMTDPQLVEELRLLDQMQQDAQKYRIKIIREQNIRSRKD